MKCHYGVFPHVIASIRDVRRALRDVASYLPQDIEV